MNPSPTQTTWSGTTAKVRLDKFSVYDWFVDVTQGLGEVTGSRVDAPECSGALPDWVSSTVDSDEDVSAAAIRVCFEPDKDERVTVRVANNRTFTQMMTMKSGGQKWAWKWPGDGHSLADIVIYPAADDVLDSSTRYLLPPLATEAVGIARPDEPGSHHIAVQATVSWQTVLVDVSAKVVEELPVGGLDNPILNAFLQVLFECGGKAAADYDSPKDLAKGVVDTVISCAREILNPDSDFGARFTDLAVKQARKSGLSVGAVQQADRITREVAGGFKVFEIGKLAFYASDQFANAKVGPLSWSINGRGKQPTLGDWERHCSSYKADSNDLYRNIALRDEFADNSKELWQFDGLKAAARKAVVPLKSCSVGYKTGLAAFLPTDWGDPKAARIVAAQLLDGLPDASVRALDSAHAPAMCDYPSYRMVDGAVPEDLITPGMVAMRSKFADSLDPMSVDMDGDAKRDLVTLFTCTRGGVNWSDVLGIYGVGTQLIGSIDLRDYNDAEHSDVMSMTPVAGGLQIRYRCYEGAGFDFKNWQGLVQLRGGKARLVDIRRR